jgi:hypothetical protein
MSDDGDNKHPADELGWARAQLREFKLREEELRQLLLQLPESERQGVIYKATVVTGTRKQLDVDALKAEFGKLDRFYVDIPFVQIRTKISPR